MSRVQYIKHVLIGLLSNLKIKIIIVLSFAAVSLSTITHFYNDSIKLEIFCLT